VLQYFTLTNVARRVLVYSA